MSENRATIALAARYGLDCEAYRLLIQARTPYRVGYCCQLHPDELAILERSCPGVVLILSDRADEATDQVLAMRRELCCRLLAVLAAPDRLLVSTWNRAGVDGILVRSDGVDDLLTALEQVLAGGRYISQRLRCGLTPLSEAQLLRSARERSILDLLARGRSLAEAALELGISAETVEECADRIALRLGAHDRAQLILLAIREHLVAP